MLFYLNICYALSLNLSYSKMKFSTIILVSLLLAHGRFICCYSELSANSGIYNPRWLFASKDSTNQLANDLRQAEVERVPNVFKEASSSTLTDYQQSSCQLVQVVHLLHQQGCLPKAIASFACSGSCSSYVQMSTSKFWQHERSCSCCQQTAIQEATFTLDCPSLDPPYRKVKTYAPIDCICRACTDLDKENLQPQELIEALASDGRNQKS